MPLEVTSVNTVLLASGRTKVPANGTFSKQKRLAGVAEIGLTCCAPYVVVVALFCVDTSALRTATRPYQLYPKRFPHSHPSTPVVSIHLSLQASDYTMLPLNLTEEHTVQRHIKPHVCTHSMGYCTVMYMHLAVGGHVLCNRKHCILWQDDRGTCLASVPHI